MLRARSRPDAEFSLANLNATRTRRGLSGARRRSSSSLGHLPAHDADHDAEDGVHHDEESEGKKRFAEAHGTPGRRSVNWFSGLNGTAYLPVKNDGSFTLDIQLSGHKERSTAWAALVQRPDLTRISFAGKPMAEAVNHEPLTRSPGP